MPCRIREDPGRAGLVSPVQYHQDFRARPEEGFHGQGIDFRLIPEVGEEDLRIRIEEPGRISVHRDQVAVAALGLGIEDALKESLLLLPEFDAAPAALGGGPGPRP